MANTGPQEPILDINFGAPNDNVDDLISSFAEVEGLGFDMEALIGLPVSPTTMTSPPGSPSAQQTPNGSPSASRVAVAETSRAAAEVSSYQYFHLYNYHRQLSGRRTQSGFW